MGSVHRRRGRRRRRETVLRRRRRPSRNRAPHRRRRRPAHRPPPQFRRRRLTLARHRHRSSHDGERLSAVSRPVVFPSRDIFSSDVYTHPSPFTTHQPVSPLVSVIHPRVRILTRRRVSRDEPTLDRSRAPARAPAVFVRRVRAPQGPRRNARSVRLDLDVNRRSRDACATRIARLTTDDDARLFLR